MLHMSKKKKGFNSDTAFRFSFVSLSAYIKTLETEFDQSDQKIEEMHKPSVIPRYYAILFKCKEINRKYALV